MISLLLIVKDHSFLFCKRREDDIAYGGYWGLPGGSVESGETPTEGLIREIEEELGFTVSSIRLLKRYDHNNRVMNVYVHDDPNFDDRVITLNEEHTEWKYFTYYEVHTLKGFIPSTTRILLDYINS